MSDAKKDWGLYVACERERVAPFLAAYDIALDDFQPQTIGERYLTRPVGGGRKVVFFGMRRARGAPVVIKTSSEPKGVAELGHEVRIHAMLKRIRFAYGVFALPAILQFDATNGFLITEYIEQEKPFLDRTLTEQFAIALEAFKAQEGAHAVTAEHWAALKKAMAENEYAVGSSEYAKIGSYVQDIAGLLAQDNPRYRPLSAALARAVELMRANENTLERYGGFLTHWDFLPQNFRIRNDNLYLLDLTSVRFGNKYEGWARFINFMTLYNPPLARALIDYVRLNRTPEELLSLKLMRAYRLVELIRYYATWLTRTEGAARELAHVRIAFWTEVLQSVLDDRDIASEVVASYKRTRDALRSEDEKVRQQGLH